LFNGLLVDEQRDAPGTVAVDLDGEVPAELRLGHQGRHAFGQLAGDDVTARSDLFALGLVLYELFTGKKAFTGIDRDTPPSTPSIVRSPGSRSAARAWMPTPSKPLASITDIMHAQGRALAVWVGTALLVLLMVVGAARLSRLVHDRR